MLEPVSIAYDLGAHGWSSFKLAIGEKSVDVGPFAYLTDALGDLIRAALVIATSGERAEVTFYSEPGEWRLIVERTPKQGDGPPEIRVAVTTWPCFVATVEGPQNPENSVVMKKVPARGPDVIVSVVSVPTSHAPPAQHVRNHGLSVVGTVAAVSDVTRNSEHAMRVELATVG